MRIVIADGSGFLRRALTARELGFVFRYDRIDDALRAAVRS